MYRTINLRLVVTSQPFGAWRESSNDRNRQRCTTEFQDAIFIWRRSMPWSFQALNGIRFVPFGISLSYLQGAFSPAPSRRRAKPCRPATAMCSKCLRYRNANFNCRPGPITDAGTGYYYIATRRRIHRGSCNLANFKVAAFHPITVLI